MLSWRSFSPPGRILWSGEAEGFSEAVETAVADGVSLDGADLAHADLRGAQLARRPRAGAGKWILGPKLLIFAGAGAGPGVADARAGAWPGVADARAGAWPGVADDVARAGVEPGVADDVARAGVEPGVADDVARAGAWPAGRPRDLA